MAGRTWETRTEIRAVTPTGTDKYQYRTNAKVLGVFPDGSYRARTTIFGGYGVFRIPMPADEPPAVRTFNAQGAPLPPENAVVETVPFRRVLLGVQSLYLPPEPLHVGARFGRQLSSHTGLGVNDAMLAYEVLKTERWQNQDALRIRFTYREVRSPVLFDGFWIVRARDGAQLAMRATGTDVPLTPDLPPAKTLIAMDLVSEG